MASIHSVTNKIVRAAEHIKSLEPELERYFKTHPGKLVREPHVRDDEAFFTFGSKTPIPARIGFIVGDCLQNLRSSLDYLVWELVLSANNQPTKDHMFPICSTSDAFKYQVCKRNRLDGIHPDAVAIIDRLQPYHLGQDARKSTLLVMDELVNINKHRRVLITQFGATDKLETIVVCGDEYFLDSGGINPVYEADTKFGPYPVINGKVHMNTQFFAVIAFGEGAAKGMEISICLNEWASYILKEIVPQFERFFK